MSNDDTKVTIETTDENGNPVQIVTTKEHLESVKMLDQSALPKLGRVLPKLGESPISQDAYDAIESHQRHQLMQGLHHATIRSSAQAIHATINKKLAEGLKLNEIVVVLIHMDPRTDHASDQILRIMDRDPVADRQKFREEKIRVPVYGRSRAEFAKRLYGVEGPEGEFGVYDPAAETLEMPIEEDRVQVIVFQGNRCTVCPLQSKPPETVEAPAAPET